ncbi:hypothetical protein WJX77_002169 [Trebouxia sp. C0004]
MAATLESAFAFFTSRTSLRSRIFELTARRSSATRKDGFRLFPSIRAGDLEDLMTAPQEQSEPAYMDVMPLEGEGPAAADNAPGAAFSPDASAKYDAVMEFCLRRGQVLFTTLMTEFVSIHLGDLERFLQKMVQEGLLEPTESKDAYRVITQSGGEAPLPRSDPPHAVMESTRGADCSVMGPDGSEYQTALQQQQQHVTDQLGNLSVHHDGGEQGSGGRAANSRKRAAEDSQAAKVSCKGMHFHRHVWTVE